MEGLVDYYGSTFTRRYILQQLVNGIETIVYLGGNVRAMGFPGGAVVKNLPANAADAGNVRSIPELGRSPGVGNGNPLQYS